jgi:hypothetical protein
MREQLSALQAVALANKRLESVFVLLLFFLRRGWWRRCLAGLLLLLLLWQATPGMGWV